MFAWGFLFLVENKMRFRVGDVVHIRAGCGWCEGRPSPVGRKGRVLHISEAKVLRPYQVQTDDGLLVFSSENELSVVEGVDGGET